MIAVAVEKRIKSVEQAQLAQKKEHEEFKQLILEVVQEAGMNNAASVSGASASEEKAVDKASKSKSE